MIPVRSGMLSRMRQFFAQTCEIRVPSSGLSPMGSPVDSWTILSRSVQCALSAYDAKQQAQREMSESRVTHKVLLFGYFPSIPLGAQVRINDLELVVRTVRHDQQSKITSLEAEQVTL